MASEVNPPQPFMHCGVTGQTLRDSFCVTFICRKMSSSIQRGHIFLFKFHTEKSLTRVVTDSSGSQWVWEPTSESLGHGKLSVPHISLPASSGDPSVMLEALAHKEELTGPSHKPEAQGCTSQVQLQILPDGTIRRIRMPGFPSPLIPPRG